MRYASTVLHRLLCPAVLVALGGSMAGCIGLAPPPRGETLSYGDTARGVLLNGVPMPDQGEGFVRARPGESTRYGTHEMIDTLTRAASEVAEQFPGSAPLRVADISAPLGGHHSRHASHRAGRDVDLIFYSTDADGRSVRGRGWIMYDRFGVARESHVPGDGQASNDLFFFDDARNWHLVRTLVMDDAAHVQWIFCSRGIRARLLRYAAATEPDAEAIFRATWVLQQPSRGNPHADHFHVRLACTPEQQDMGCTDRGPIWPWIRKDVEKPAPGNSEALTDEALVAALLSDPDDLEGATLARLER